MDADMLSRAEAIQLVEAIRKGVWECPSHAALSIHFAAAIWALRTNRDHLIVNSKTRLDLREHFDMVVNIPDRWAKSCAFLLLPHLLIVS